MTENGGNFGKQVNGQWVNLWNIATKNDVYVQKGTLDIPSIPAGSYVDTLQIAFPVSYLTEPVMSLTPNGSTLQIMPILKAVAAEYFSVRVYNLTNSTIEGRTVRWYAVGSIK